MGKRRQHLRADRAGRKGQACGGTADSRQPPPSREKKRPDSIPPVSVIGIIDAYGAIHYQKLWLGDEQSHEHYWPGQTHKRWRFDVRNWSLDQSILSSVKLDSEDGERVIAKMLKVLTPPEWVLRNEAWDAAGRPRGEAHVRWEKKWERQRKLLRKK